MDIGDIKSMSREHLESLVEYIIRQKETHINVAPPGWGRAEKTAWVRGFDYLRARLVKMAASHELLKDHLPERNRQDPITRLESLFAEADSLIEQHPELVQEVDQEQFGRIEKLVEGVEVDDLPTRPSTQKESAIVADFIRGKSKIIKPEIPDSW